MEEERKRGRDKWRGEEKDAVRGRRRMKGGKEGQMREYEG